MSTRRKNVVKEFRKLKLQQLTIQEIAAGRNPNNQWFAEQLGVTGRTLRNYRYELEMVELHTHDDTGKAVSMLVTMEEAARRLNISTAECRRRAKRRF
jgi:hypothetical protein